MAHLRFHIAYRTEWGECLCVDYAVPGGEERRLPLSTSDGRAWTGTLELEAGTPVLYYNYCVCREGGEDVRRERCRRALPLLRRTRLFLDDCWEDDSIHPALRRSAFTECVFRPSALETLSSPYALSLRALPPPEGRHWAVVGQSGHLGSWRSDAAKRLVRTGVYEWGLPLTSSEFAEGTEYKYLLVDDADASKVEWEQGDNRRINAVALERNEAAVHSDAFPRFPLPLWRGAGVVVPVFSLRSEGSFGIGDFGDLKRLVAWAASTGLRAIQLLPINDTTTTGTWRDSYPYSAISVFALHPIYLDMRRWRTSPAYRAHEKRGRELNALPELDYEGVFREKMAFLHELFRENGAAVLKSPRYKAFCEENKRWLPAYSRFCRLRDEHGTADFRTWKKEDAGKPLAGRRQAAEDFYSYVQYLLHRQMSAAHEYAREKGVILKGDIPIGVCRDSVPAWADGRLFHFDGQAGAPPDAFARHGQNWGFPTYDWEEMGKDGYAWWRERFRHMGNYFDAYRIDHVLGFFRIWEIPYGQVYGLLGRFRPALPLSEKEIRDFGFSAPVADFARPVLTERRLEELSEDVSGRGLRRFFRPCGEEGGQERYVLKPEYATQRAILAATGDEALRKILLDVVAEVLFIEDADSPGHFHPRIGAQETWRFGCLSEADRAAFNRLHDDFFYVRHNRFWADEAMKKLPSIIGDPAAPAACDAAEAPLLPCAEDLGMVPAGVKGVLERLNVLSLEIQRMPKRYGVRFDDLARNPWLSVSTIATHDMPPFRLWWRERREQTQAFWREVLHREGQAPEEASPEVCEQIVSLHLESPSMLCLLALQDLLAIDATLRRPDPAAEQINVPANPDQYWRYRMHLTIEELTAATGFNEKLRGLILRSGRNA